MTVVKKILFSLSVTAVVAAIGSVKPATANPLMSASILAGTSGTAYSVSYYHHWHHHHHHGGIVVRL